MRKEDLLLHMLAITGECHLDRASLAHGPVLGVLKQRTFMSAQATGLVAEYGFGFRA